MWNGHILVALGDGREFQIDLTSPVWSRLAKTSTDLTVRPRSIEKNDPWLTINNLNSTDTIEVDKNAEAYRMTGPEVRGLPEVFPLAGEMCPEAVLEAVVRAAR